MDDPLNQIIESLAASEKIIAEDFRSRGQSISDLVDLPRLQNGTGYNVLTCSKVYNIINVRQAQAAQRSADAAKQESRDLGRISWITFIFFPLISVSVLISRLFLRIS